MIRIVQTIHQKLRLFKKFGLTIHAELRQPTAIIIYNDLGGFDKMSVDEIKDLRKKNQY